MPQTVDLGYVIGQQGVKGDTGPSGPMGPTSSMGSKGNTGPDIERDVLNDLLVSDLGT